MRLNLLKYGNFGSCGFARNEGQITKDGRYLFAFLDAYSGSYGTPRLFIYDMNGGNPVKVATVLGRVYPRPTAAFAMNNNGSRFVLWNRRYSDDPSYSPELELYSFNGSTATKLARAAEPGLGAYSSPAISDDGQWIYFGSALYQWNGTTLSKTPTYAPDLTAYAMAGTQVFWSQALNGFFIGHSSGIIFMSQDAQGRWIQKTAISYAGTQYYNHVSISDDGNRIIAVLDATGTDLIPHVHVFDRSDASWTKVAQFDLPAKPRTYTMNYGILSSGLGKFLLYPYDPVIQQYDLSKASSGIVTRTSDIVLDTRMNDDGQSNLIHTRMTDVKSGYTLINNYSATNNGTVNGLFQLFYTDP